MKRDIMVGLITGSIIGATMSRYTFSHINPKKQKKILKRSKKVLCAATHILGGLHLM